MFNLHQLRIFHLVATHGSYSRAAEHLGISQPAVSMQVARLAETAGVALVSQKGRQVALTDAGEALAHYADRILRLADEAALALEEFRGLRRGRLRLAASSTPGAYILPEVVAALRHQYPGVEVSLEIGNTRAAAQAVADGLADLAVVGAVPAEPPEGVAFSPLCQDQLVVAVPPGHRWAGMKAVRAADLAAEPLILREEGSSTRAVLAQRLREAGLSLRVGLELGSTEAVKEAVIAGLGATVLSAWAVRREFRAGILAALPVDGLALHRSLHLAMARHGSQSGTAEAFVALLRGARLDAPFPGPK